MFKIILKSTSKNFFTPFMVKEVDAVDKTKQSMAFSTLDLPDKASRDASLK